MQILTTVLLAVPMLYSAVVVYFIFLLLKKHGTIPSDSSTQQLPGISIVIPFRDEADNLPGLIDSLDAQTYAGEVEIILVNDASTDHFMEALGSRPGSLSETLDRPRPILRIIDSPPPSAIRLTSKQRALDFGITAAKYDWIALTDADMVFGPTWLESLIKPSSGGAKLVFGHTAIVQVRGKSLFTWFQSFQLETLFSFAHVFNRAGITGSCMGNNMLISREAYRAVGGCASIGYSIVEDRDLLAAFRKKKIPVATTDPFVPGAFTRPSATLSSYRHQLLRWARGGFGSHSALSFFGALLLAHTAVFLIATAGALPVWLWATAMAGQLLTWLFVTISFKKNGSTASPLLFPVFYTVFLVETLLVCIALLTKSRVVWKEREL